MGFGAYAAGFMQGIGFVFLFLNLYISVLFVLLGLYCVRLDRKAKEAEMEGSA